MVQEIIKNFEVKKAETLKSHEGVLSPEQEKEILREAIKERLDTGQVSASQQQIVAQTAQNIKDEPKERQIELLTNLAFEKGIVEAVKVAQKLDNPYLLDEFHDTLVDKLYNKLVAEKKLEQI